MNRSFVKKISILSLVFAIGIGVGMKFNQNTGPQFDWPSISAHASATEGEDNFAISTGLVDSGVEALYFLDYLTGDLRAAVLNRKTGQFNAAYSYNIAADFAAEGGKNPKYLMVTGLADMPRGRNNFQIAKSVVYVADATTGKVGVYAIPWNSSRQAAGAAQAGTFVRLDLQTFRTTELRD